MAEDCDSNSSLGLPLTSEVIQSQKQQIQSCSHLKDEVLQEVSGVGSNNLAFENGAKTDRVVPENTAKNRDVVEEQIFFHEDVKSVGAGSLGSDILVKPRLKAFDGVGVLSESELFDSKLPESNSDEGAVNCALKIQVINDTALIETSETGRGAWNFSEVSRNNNKGNVKQEIDGIKEKKPKRRGKSGKNKVSGAEEKEKNHDLHVNHVGKKVYLRKELEALRHTEGLELQKKRWVEVYCGLGPAVQKEYNELVTFNHNSQKQQQHKQNNKKRTSLNFNPQFPHEAPPLLFGPLAGKGRGNRLKVFVH